MTTKGRKADETIQDKMVKNIVDKKQPPREAARLAGYSDGTKMSDIMRVSGPVFKKLQQALAEQGITPETWAGEYVDGLKASKEAGSKDKNLNAHAQYLRQIGHILTGGIPKAPTVAVQVNNGTAAPSVGLDAAGIAKLEGKLQTLLTAIESEQGKRESGRVHADGTRPEDSEAHSGVVDVTPEREEPVDRGES